MSYIHNPELLDHYNLVEQMEKLIKVDDTAGIFHIASSVKEDLFSENSNINFKQQSFSEKFLMWFHNSLIYILIVIFSVIVIIWSIRNCLCPINLNRIIKQKHHLKRETSGIEIEMKELQQMVEHNTSTIDQVLEHQQTINTDRIHLDQLTNQKEIKKFQKLKI